MIPEDVQERNIAKDMFGLSIRMRLKIVCSSPREHEAQGVSVHKYCRKHTEFVDGQSSSKRVAHLHCLTGLGTQPELGCNQIIVWAESGR